MHVRVAAGQRARQLPYRAECPTVAQLTRHAWNGLRVVGHLMAIPMTVKGLGSGNLIGADVCEAVNVCIRVMFARPSGVCKLVPTVFVLPVMIMIW